MKSEFNNNTEIEHLASLGRLSSAVFHDMANTLTALSLSTEELCQTGQSILHDRISHTTHKLLRLFNQIKKYQRHGSPKSHFSVATEITEAIDLLHYKATSQSVIIRFEPKLEYHFFGNKTAFFQIIVNLISNAIDSYKDTPTTQRTIEVAIEKDATLMYISVTDHGQGIPEHILPHIFKPFFSTKPVSEGTGVGLSLTKHILETEFNGHIHVHSTPNQGAIFTVSLPL